MTAFEIVQPGPNSLGSHSMSFKSKKRKAADMTVADKVEKENKAKAANDGKSSGKGAKESTKPAKPAKV